MKRWSHKSLEWIHKIREENYRKTKNMSIPELLNNTRHVTDEIIESLGLRKISLKSNFFQPVVRDKKKD